MASKMMDEIKYFLWKHPGFKSACKTCCWIFFLPCTFCYSACCAPRYKCGNGLRMAARRKEREMATIRYQHQEKSFKRRKSLSAGTKSGGLRALFGQPPKTSNQSQSALFAKLPAEIRLKIYKIVLNDEPLLHIALCGRRLGIAPCDFNVEDTEADVPDLQHIRFSEYDAYDGTFDTLTAYQHRSNLIFANLPPGPAHFELLPLLTTCRMM